MEPEPEEAKGLLSVSLLLLHEPTSSAVGSCVDAIKAVQPQLPQTGPAGCSMTRQVRRPAIFGIVCEKAFSLNALFFLSSCSSSPAELQADGCIGFGSRVSYSPLMWCIHQKSMELTLAAGLLMQSPVY